MYIKEKGKLNIGPIFKSSLIKRLRVLGFSRSVLT
jgi:hypothetical protein